jgi:hypothetical protein
VKDIPAGFTANDRRKISERLKSMENRTYLWLHLIFDAIEEMLVYGKRSSIEKLLSDIPSQVSEAYEKILSRSPNETYTKILLQIVLVAAHPLTLDEANVALILALQEERFVSHVALESELWTRDKFPGIVKNLCGLFINVYDLKLSFIHQTAREYLTHKERQGKWQGCLNMSKSHSMMSQSCLHYLLLPDIGKPVGDNPAEGKQPPFLPYAAAHWPLHFVSQEAAVADRSRKEARMLCNIAGGQAGIWVPSNLRERNIDWESWTDLTLASYLGLTLAVEDVLLEGADVNFVGGDYPTALQAASAQGHQGIVQMLLDESADVDLQGGGWTPLHFAAKHGHLGAAEVLLKAGASVDWVNENQGWTPLFHSITQHNLDMARLLVSWGADISWRTSEDGTSVAERAEEEDLLEHAAWRDLKI